MKKSVSICIGIIIAVVSCNVYKDVQIFRDRSIDFEKYETYALLPESKHSEDSVYADDYIRQQTRAYLIHCFAERGLQPDTANAQLLLQIEWLSHAREVTLPTVYDTPDIFDAGYYNAPTLYLKNGKLTGKPGWRYDYTKPEKMEYIHGGVKLSAIDRETNVLVWEGVAQGDLYDHKAKYEDLHPAIHKMMKRFPIKIQ